MTVSQLQDSTPATLPAPPDIVGMIHMAALNHKCRERASIYLNMAFAGRPLARDHGTQHPRPSDFGRCSLEYVADLNGALDLPIDVESQILLLDNGTFMGAWLASLCCAAVDVFKLPYVASVEYAASYRGVVGHVDLVLVNVQPGPGHKAGIAEVAEFKSVKGTGKLISPEERKTFHVMQAGHYGIAVSAVREHVVQWGPNVGKNKDGIPYPKMRQDTFDVVDWKDEVDAEIDRLRLLEKAKLSTLSDDQRKALADPDYEWRCESCRFSPCAKNANPERFVI